MYIKDLLNGSVRKYGSDHHDSLTISGDGRRLTYYNLQNGDGSCVGNYVFCDEDGLTPDEAAEKYKCVEYATDSYFNIGGFSHVFEFGDLNVSIIYDTHPDDTCVIRLNHNYDRIEKSSDKKMIDINGKYREEYINPECMLVFRDEKSIDTFIDMLKDFKEHLKK